MGGNVQCPVCTLFLLPGMNLSDHLETHPKEQVIKALVQMSLKTETTESTATATTTATSTPDNTPKKSPNKSSSFSEADETSHLATEDERTSPISEISGSVSDCATSLLEPATTKRTEKESNSTLFQNATTSNILNRQGQGYIFENNSSSSNSSSNTFFGPPTPYYQHHQQQQQQQQQNHQQQLQQQQQQQHQQQQHQQQHHHQQQQQNINHQHLNHNYQPYHGLSHGGGNNNFTGHGPTHPPMRLFSYQPTPKPLQPPPAYGAAISQLRSQNSQNLMSNTVHRPLYSPANYNLTPSASSSAASSSLSTPSRLPPPLPPPPLNQRYQSNFETMDASFTDTDDTSAISPRRTSMTPPIRPPPQLYRSPQSSSNAPFSRQSSSPYSVMSGSPSVLRFAESPVTAHYLERENGDFIVQETPKHVVECVEKDDGEFSVIERVYHMPPSVVQINEDEEDDMSEQGANSEDVKLLVEDDRPNESWTSGDSSDQGQPPERTEKQQKKSSITVLSDVQLDLSEYLDLMGNIIASGKVAKTRSELIKVEKFEPDDEVKEEDTICLDDDDNESSSPPMSINQKFKDTEDSSNEPTAYCPLPLPSAFSNMDSCASAASVAAPSSVTPMTTSVIRLAATSIAKTSLPAPAAPTKIEEPIEEDEQEEEQQSSSNTSKTTTKKIATEQMEVSNVAVKAVAEEAASAEEENKPTTSLKIEIDSTSNSKSSLMDVELVGTSTSTSSSTNTPPTKKTDEAAKATILENSISSQAPTDDTSDKTQNRDTASLPSTSSTQSSVGKRPIKKGPKKLIIKPKSKDPSTSKALTTEKTVAASLRDTVPPPIQIPIQMPMPIPIPIPSTSTEASKIQEKEQKQKQQRQQQQQQKEESPTEDSSARGDGLNSIKIESVSSVASDPILLRPLLADADEKLPPEDDAQPSTSSRLIISEEKRDVEDYDDDDLDGQKPTADLTALLDECLKKEEEEDHPMHSIFGMDIRATEQTLNNALTPPPPSTTTEFPSSSLFAKPLTATTSENLSIPESMLLDGSNLHEPDDHHLHSHPHPHQQQEHQQASSSNFVEYPFSFLYGGEANHQEEDDKHNIPAPIYCTEDFNKYSVSTSGGNSASCTWYQSQSSENDFEMDGKGSYLDLDSCKRSTSFAAATEGSMPTSDALNIRTDEKMPAKGEISEQESNCGVENSWSQPLYNEFAVRFPNPYQNFMSNHESWSQDHYFRPQDLSSSVETKNFPLRSTEEPSAVIDALPSTSKRKTRDSAIAKLPRKKNFQCTHCNTHFPLLKEKNAHMIKQHGYKRVNRRLIRDPPTSTVTTATLNATDPAGVGAGSLLLGLDGPLPVGDDEDSKAAIVKIEQENQDCKNKNSSTNLAISSKKVSSSTSAAAANSGTNASRTKYDSMRARDNRMLINFNLSALNVKNEGEVHNYYLESKSSFCCFVCKRDFLTVKLFDEHLVEHPAECFTCHKKFTRWKNFMVHLKRHLGWKDFACTYCEKKFVIRSALVEHMRMHTGQTPLKCKICGKSFKRYSNLTQHRKRHGTKINRSKEYVCFCGEVLPSKARFIWHKETHDLKPKCCPYCRDRFVHANSLRRHIRLAHSDKFDYTEPMECPMCKQIYAKSSIKAHMATHSIDTQHECLICSKSFSTKWNLKIHNWVHANRTTKPFKCEQCVKAFVREVDYNNHINSHKQIKPYTCEHCGCKFIRKYNYIRHRREHHGNKKFTCDLCGKLFHRHYYLIEHRRIHTGERPFQCTICGKSSTTKTNHNKHLKIHHSRDPFTSEA
ncbi:uncharacterized protein LOC129953484 [Eupeodes corollae]|uniref:uncharacterized protein LOC129953484 n=1 Tax=Eupeodes corollae TaxID=290404 RepID=UPI00249117EE|nr:uncharacterized protein LOC129953484 [Eupeodes corollae]XP_055922713.1 uncharacterized protein LOC129953484 [Eupeodes corollae]